MVVLEAKSNSSQAKLVKPDEVNQTMNSYGLPGLWSLRHLTGLMVQRDLMGRYKGSLMGAFWPVINPVGHLILYTFLFNMILKVRFGDDPSLSNFALYLMTGLIGWGAFAESLARSTTCILEVPNLVKRVVFPLEILPLVLVISSFLSQSFALVSLLAFIAVSQHGLHATILFLPLIALSQAFLTTGITWILASLGVFIRDIRHAISLVLSAWMYATPIVYPQSYLPKEFKFLLWLNPMAGIIEDYRRVLLSGLAPDWTTYFTYTAVGIVVCILGYNLFFKTKKTFADVM
jgi:lipopolysaccharide transport system permease protein